MTANIEISREKTSEWNAVDFSCWKKSQTFILFLNNKNGEFWVNKKTQRLLMYCWANDIGNLVTEEDFRSLYKSLGQGKWREKLQVVKKQRNDHSKKKPHRTIFLEKLGTAPRPSTNFNMKKKIQIGNTKKKTLVLKYGKWRWRKNYNVKYLLVFLSAARFSRDGYPEEASWKWPSDSFETKAWWKKKNASNKKLYHCQMEL